MPAQIKTINNIKSPSSSQTNIGWLCSH